MIYGCLFICVALCLFFPPAMMAGVCCLGCTSTTTVAATIVAAVRRFGEAGNACQMNESVYFTTAEGEEYTFA